MRVCIIRAIVAGVVAGALWQAAYASDATSRLAVAGQSDFQLYNLVKSNETSNKDVPSDTFYNNTWSERIGGIFALTMTLNDRFDVHFGINAHMGNGLQQNYPTYLSYRSKGAGASVELGYLQYRFGDPAKPPVSLTFGYFNEDYAPENKDLGEYLFRCGTYPGFVLSGPYGYNLLGLRLQSKDWVKGLLVQALFTCEISIFPAYDWSPSLLAQYTIADMLTIGGGVMFSRLVQPMPKNTTPVRFAYTTPSGERVTYTAQGTKLMARLSFDPKPLFHTSIFGQEDLLLYAEWAWLGVKDYPYFYDTATQRMPVMAGFHVPAFKLLDYCAVEGEWYGSIWKNDIYNNGVPYPSIQGTPPGHVDDIKWAVVAAKTIPGCLTLTARAGRDHSGDLSYQGVTGLVELTVRPGEWYWSLTATSQFSVDNILGNFKK